MLVQKRNLCPEGSRDMRIPVNYGEFHFKEDKIIVGPSLISRAVGWLMLSVIVVLFLFLSIIGVGYQELKDVPKTVFILPTVIIYLSLRFMGASSDLMLIDGNDKTISVKKRRLFIPIRRMSYKFDDIASVNWDEANNKSVMGKGADMVEVAFRLKGGGTISIATISCAELKSAHQAATKITSKIAEIVECPAINLSSQ